MFIYDTNRSLSSYKEHNLSSITWKIILKGWIDIIEENPDRIIMEINVFLEQIKNRLIEILDVDAESFFDEMTASQQLAMADNIITSGGDIARLGEMQQSGHYLKYVPEKFLMSIFLRVPEKFFNGGVWDVSYDSVSDTPLSEEIARHAQQRIQQAYKNCLEDLIMFITHKPSDNLILQRAKLSLEFLQRKWVI